MKLNVTVLVSIILYGSLALTSLWNFIPLYAEGWKGGRSGLFSGTPSVDGYNAAVTNLVPLRFKQGAKAFFFMLLMSSLCDLPFLIGCLAKGTPDQCRWDTMSYYVTYATHLLSLIGYFICLAVPLKLWSDLIAGREESLFTLRFTYADPPVIILSSLLFAVLVGVEIITLTAVGPFKYNDATDATRGLESFCYVFVAIYWTVKGLYLMYHLKGMLPDDSDQIRVLFNATMIMLIICITYLFRAGVIMSTVFGGNSFFEEHYPFWLVSTRWLPYVISSYLLIFVIRMSLRSLKAHYNSGAPPMSSSAFSSVSERRNSFPIFGAEYSDLEKLDTTALYGRQQTSYFDDSGSHFSLHWINILNRPAKDRILEEGNDQDEALIQ
jgi:uncharacterized membrane protein YozB (DUF420 family)